MLMRSTQFATHEEVRDASSKEKQPGIQINATLDENDNVLNESIADVRQYVINDRHDETTSMLPLIYVPCACYLDDP